MSAGSRQAPPMPMVITVSGNRSRIRARHPELRRLASAGSGTTITTSSSRIEVIAPGIRVVKKWSMAAATRSRATAAGRAGPEASKATARTRCSRAGS